MRWIVVLAAPVLLGGCLVTSEKPLFGPKDAAPNQLAKGLWGLYGPGCDVVPLKELPECAIPMTVTADKLDIDPKKLVSGPLADLPSGGAVTSSPDGPMDYLMADGKPPILQMISKGKDGKAQPPGYMAVSPLHANGAGEVDRAVMWMITCPGKGESKAGFKTSLPGCEAINAEAVRRRAPHVPPLFSFFITWVKPPG